MVCPSNKKPAVTGVTTGHCNRKGGKVTPCVSMLLTTPADYDGHICDATGTILANLRVVRFESVHTSNDGRLIAECSCNVHTSDE
jgi:hypothetical protein